MTIGALLLSLALMSQAATGEVIADVLVHGNHLTGDDEIIRLAGLTIGAAFDPGTIETARRRLRDSGKFDDVDVLKRLASIADPSRIVVVIVVNEGPVRIEVPDDPAAPVQVVKRRGPANFMWAPILDGEDGYGLTFGVRFALVNVSGRRGRISIPLSWGGTKQAGVEFERLLTGPLTRIAAGAAVERRHNPAFDEDDDRRRVWVRAERTLGSLRLGATSGWQNIRFTTFDDQMSYAGFDATFDTRLDPVLPRNAVFASAAWTHYWFEAAPSLDRLRLDARGYLALVGQSILVGRVVREEANRPQPPYFESLLGGWSNLRGFKAGSFTGDPLVTGSVELRLPVSSPLEVAKLGLSIFADTGTVYGSTERLGDQPFYTGAGAGVWVAVTLVQFGVSVAHGLDAGTRVNFGLALRY